MVTLTKGTTGYIYLTLTDKRLTQSDTYTLLFVNEVTDEEVTMSLADISTNKNRNSKFEILDTYFSTSTVGFWRYYISQSGTNIATGKFELVSTSVNDTVRYDGYNGSYKTYTL